MPQRRSVETDMSARQERLDASMRSLAARKGPGFRPTGRRSTIGPPTTISAPCKSREGDAG